MYDMPILKFELSGLQHSIAKMLVERNGEINKHVIQSIDRQLTEDWVISEIDSAVKKCLQRAISEIANDYNLRCTITELISKTVSEKLSAIDK